MKQFTSHGKNAEHSKHRGNDGGRLPSYGTETERRLPHAEKDTIAIITGPGGDEPSNAATVDPVLGTEREKTGSGARGWRLPRGYVPEAATPCDVRSPDPTCRCAFRE